MPVLGIKPKSKIKSGSTASKASSTDAADEAKAYLEEVKQRSEADPDKCMFC